jgi:hypothetical protein
VVRTIAADYAQLLRDGFIRRDLRPELHAKWRYEIRQKARLDHLRLRTGSASTPTRVWATLLDWNQSEREVRQAITRIVLITCPRNDPPGVV